MSNTSVYDDFSKFCSNIKIPNATLEIVESRIKAITKRINKDYWGSDSETEHSLVVGSYGRGTAIRTSDIDIIVELPWSEYSRFNNYSGNGQSALLQSVKQCLLKTYSSSNVSGDGQVVDIDFSDGIKFEIVPAFKFTDGRYYYPDTNNGGTWKSMDPAKELLVFDYVDTIYKGNLKNLCRMARAWKSEMTVLMPGILIDTIAYRFLEEYKYSKNSFTYYDWMSRDFFKYIIDNEATSAWVKFGSGDTVTKKYGISVNSDSEKAYQLAKDAITASSENDDHTWHTKWRQIYGYKFPSA